MQEILNKICETNPENFLKNNALLQSKKSALREELSQMGILQKEGHNTFDKYKYFSEAQYKELFTRLFSKHRLELKSSEMTYTDFQGTQKQPFGRKVKIEFCLIDCDTGFFELSYITGEGLDKGDKAGYKANTGAIKYYLADTFLVATGDDPEKETSLSSPNFSSNSNVYELADKLSKMLSLTEQSAVLKKYNVQDFCQLPEVLLSALLSKKQKNINRECEAC